MKIEGVTGHLVSASEFVSGDGTPGAASKSSCRSVFASGHTRERCAVWARRRRDFALTERSAGDTSDVVVAEHTRERNEPETSRTPALPRTAAQHPLLDLQRGVGNQAVARAVLARNPKYKHEAGYKKCGVDEREY